MSDSEGDSRTAAVGRKRNAAGEYKSQPESRRPSASSKESGEVSTSSDSNNDGSDDDSDSNDSDSIEEITADQFSKRRKTTAASEEGEISSDMDTDSDSTNTSSSSSNASVSEIPQPTPPKKTQTLISDLPQTDREAQRKYFNITSPHAPARCLSCGERGHMASTCPARTCAHCKRRDAHASSGCPTYRKCSLCRERGHDARVCRNRAYRGPGDLCDVCAQAGHVEEECPFLWRISVEVGGRTGGNVEGRGGGGLNYDDEEEEADSSPPPPPPPLLPPPEREQRRPWQLMGLFDDTRD